MPHGIRGQCAMQSECNASVIISIQTSRALHCMPFLAKRVAAASNQNISNLCCLNLYVSYHAKPACKGRSLADAGSSGLRASDCYPSAITFEGIGPPLCLAALDLVT